MKNILYISFILLLAASLSSCERVIDIDLHNAQAKFVIEGIVSNRPDTPARVLITTTKPFTEDNNFPGVSGATVTISDNGGAPVPLIEKTTGVYEAPLFGAIGHTYDLKVTINGTLYTATSTMPQQIKMDSLYVTNESLFGDERKIANVDFKDPLGKGNAYRWIQYINERKEKTIFVRDDDLSDGRNVNRKLFYFNDSDDDDPDKDARDIKTGDKLRIEMLCIDIYVYKYWYSLDASATGENQQATPANPVNNIKGGNGVLGYFSAQTYESKEIIVP